MKNLSETSNYMITRGSSLETENYRQSVLWNIFPSASENKYRSVGRHCIFLNDALVPWRTKELKLIGTSTTASGRLALFGLARECMLLRHFTEEIYYQQIFPIRFTWTTKMHLQWPSKQLHRILQNIWQLNIASSRTWSKIQNSNSICFS